MSDVDQIKPSFMAHIVLKTKDRERLINWYKTVFYAEELFSNEVLTFLTFDDEHHRFAVIQLPPEAPDYDPSAVGVAHWAYSFANVEELVATYERLKAVGILPHTPVNHGLTYSMYYSDPDGNDMELQVDALATPEECKAVFSSEYFASNPFGDRYDPDVFCRAIRDGVAPAEAMQSAEAAWQ